MQNSEKRGCVEGLKALFPNDFAGESFRSIWAGKIFREKVFNLASNTVFDINSLGDLRKLIL